MGRCEGCHRLENRRCERDGDGVVRAADGELYVVCGYHSRHAWTADVARWQGETGLRAARSTPLRASRPERRSLEEVLAQGAERIRTAVGVIRGYSLAIRSKAHAARPSLA